MGVVQTYEWRLNRKETAANADAELKDYRHRHQKSRRPEVAGLKSPSLDGMPRTDSIENGQEGKLLGHLSDQEFCQQVVRAIECIEDDDQRTILTLLYITKPITAEAIQQRLHMSNTAYYHKLEDALVSFAEVWPPIPSDLLVYHSERL
ncbi:DUF1492 domain-containing protein [Lacticaseibacillus manihotivorans]|uniref:DUF1492 domain-containing protein n=1 Tax=Lacticaseibacillus manihotivorans TaxID=88233 RepID=A0A5P8JQE6_9LACO|nr:DUF1492 domain-containing protein [Lacticaseibacillus manihotivorans]QFQ91004.1 DUF1492 domain-containing protein [Lacticaseibacillus manihotivorans]